ncbi:MipA/OmpV family protein [Marinicella sp. S1101]|uniref:MipA/OmpV family protein n=1 Tax=Marinicella marina TaxID=2996016 RepID=UPI002260FF9B|nr:MipA/OmpV family protein [Marinicella marina]MCX7552961.1 MipA/OmpV family protein [Marinicella marina]MDJ1139729.1 MipA/OmpV family protein [Marinicella marina]
MKNFVFKICLICSISFSTYAQPVPDSAADEHELQIGIAGVGSESVYVGGDSQTRFFPAIDYQYKRFYFQAGDIGFNLIDNKAWEVNFGMGFNLAGDIDRGDSRLLQDLPNLSFPISAFVSAQYKTKFGLFTVKHDNEINNKHDGHSSSLSYAAPIFKNNWLLMPSLSYQYHSAEVVNYFYGVNTADATERFDAYQTGSVNNIQLSFLALREINEKWSFVGNVQSEFYGDEISNSPIVDDDQRLSLFVGLLYKVF